MGSIITLCDILTQDINMINIKDIYQWIIHRPILPSGLTPLQIKEWNLQNSKSIEEYDNRSFIGELLGDSTVIEYITEDSIGALTIYIDERHTWRPQILRVEYFISFDASFYETIRLIHNYCRVEFEGKILNFNKTWKNYDNGSLEGSSVTCCNIQLNLSNIKVIERKVRLNHDIHAFVSSELLDTRFAPPTPKNSKCFIATATLVSIGKSEKCEELNFFRIFRDTWLSKQPDGQKLILEYYNIAPQIVKAINSQNDSINIYNNLWYNNIEPCFKLIKNNSYEEAKSIYCKVVTDLKQKYLDK